MKKEYINKRDLRKLLGTKAAGGLSTYVGSGTTSTPAIPETNSDSIPGYSPIIVKFTDTNELDILTFSELWELIQGDIFVTDTGKERKIFPSNIKIFRGLGANINNKKTTVVWDTVFNIYRHMWGGNLIRVRAKAGIVDTTPNHSIVTRFVERDSKNIQINDQLCLPYSRYIGRKGPKGFFVGNEELAWLFGLFSADGTISTNEVIIANKNKDYIDRCYAIFESELNVKPCIVLDNNGIYRIETRNRHLRDFFLYNFYTTTISYKDGRRKRVPKFILNSPNSIKRAYYIGYYCGDGDKSSNHNRFSTDSQVLATGLIWIYQSYSASLYTVNYREDKPKVIDVLMPRYNRGKNRTIVTTISSIEYSGFVYDLSTESGTFITGVPGVLVHNTVDNIHASDTPLPNTIVALDSSSKFPNSTIDSDSETLGKFVQADGTGDIYWGEAVVVSDTEPTVTYSGLLWVDTSV
jgi:intein/homing endonuclease